MLSRASKLRTTRAGRRSSGNSLKSYMRFYSFVAQVIRLGDTGLEKLYTYADWLSRLLPNRDIPVDIEVTEDMLRLQAFRVEQKEHGVASLDPGDTHDTHTDQRIRRQSRTRKRKNVPSPRSSRRSMTDTGRRSPARTSSVSSGSTAKSWMTT